MRYLTTFLEKAGLLEGDLDYHLVRASTSIRPAPSETVRLLKTLR
jgi:hypothetical protein